MAAKAYSRSTSFLLPYLRPCPSLCPQGVIYHVNLRHSLSRRLAWLAATENATSVAQLAVQVGVEVYGVGLVYKGAGFRAGAWLAWPAIIASQQANTYR